METKIEVMKYLRQYVNGNNEAIEDIYHLCRLDRESLEYFCNKAKAEILSATRAAISYDGAWNAKQAILKKYTGKILGE